ncbi:carboxymuconolactone decarboxylase family protein [Hoeflea sp. CAU 1731]
MNDPLFDKGLEVRKKVLGNKYVEKSLQDADDFTLPLQSLVTKFCWGEVWGRPGLDLKTRSIINIAMISVLNRPAELRLHVRGALNNGLTKEEIREILLQVAVYAGIPASLDSFRVARESIEEYNSEAES